MQKITLWYRFNKSSNSFDFNHFEYGLSLLDSPLPLFSSQNSWKSFKWSKSYAIIDNNIISGESHV